MARLLSRRTFGALVGALCACSCLGGQTGQPQSASCEQTPVAAGELWKGQTVQALAQALAGSHSASLYWREQPSDAGMSTPVALGDGIVITLTYAGARGMLSCGAELDVPVEVTLSSEASGIAEQGPGVLRFTTLASPLSAGLTYASSRLTLAATLTAHEEQVAPLGELDAQEDDLPGASARIGGKP